MLRFLVAAGATLAILGLAACGHRAAAAPGASQPSQSGATLGTFVMDATPASPDPSSPAANQPGAGQAAAGAACGQGQDAYKVLVFLVSSDTGTSVRTIVADLRSGQTLAQVAGGKAGQVEQQADDLVQAWLQFAEANGKVTADQASWYRTVARGVIGGLMTANVASCVPSAG